MPNSSQQINVDDFRDKLKLKSQQTASEFKNRYQDAHRYLSSQNIDISGLRKHSSKLLGAGALAGTLLLTPPSQLDNTKSLSKTTQSLGLSAKNEEVKLPGVAFRESLLNALPQKVRPLERSEEKQIEKLIEENIGIKAKATLEGEHLNTTYGLIGAEQHLKRFPGDSLQQHTPSTDQYGADNPSDVLKEGIAPGLGAWGYFAPSKTALTPELEQTERWYAVVQTLYLPDWAGRQPYLRDWYKYRKVLIVNTDNGKAVVASIADAGPAAWTGKHFGGSPEVMDYLGGARYKKGPVLVFFVDDPENKIPLGPVEYETGNMLLSKI